MYKFYINFIFIYILVLCLHFVLTKEAGKPEHAKSMSPSERDKKDDFIESSHEHNAARKWRENDLHAREMCEKLYSKILPYLSNISNDLDLSPGCKKSLMKTLIGVKNYKLWALKMLDSSGKIPIGILKLNGISLGNYDECLEVDVPGYFRGQYCTLIMSQQFPKRERFTTRFKPIPQFENYSRTVSEDSVTAKLYKDSSLLYNASPRIAVCTPSTCSNKEIEKLANKVVESLKMNYQVHVPDCDVLEENFKFSGRDIAILLILGTLLFIAITSTIVDVYLKLMTTEERYQVNLGLPIKYLLCFSFYTNTRRLLAPDTSPDTIKVFYGMRVLAMLYIMLGHVYDLNVLYLCRDWNNILEYINDFSFSFVVQGLIAVEAFFFMSSVVHSYAIMKIGDRKINYALHIFRRILRVLIPFLFILACVFLIPHFGSGPGWKETMEKRIEGNCRSNWWKNLLFINNFSSYKEMCLSFTWYIAADTHLFLLSLLVVIPMRRNPRHGFTMNLLLLLGGISLSEMFRYYYGTAKTLPMINSQVDDIIFVTEVEHYPTYEHISSCCVGLAVGYFLAKRPAGWKIPLKINLSLWLSSFVAFIIVIYGPYSWNLGNFPNIALCILFKSTYRLLWSLAIGWVTIACHTGNGGFVNTILSWPAFVPLARLTYMVYLTHKIILYIYFGSTRSLIDMTHSTLVYIYFATIMMSFMCAYVLGLLFESPFLALQSLTLSLYASKDSNMYKPLKHVKDFSNDHGNAEKSRYGIRMEENTTNEYGTMEYRKSMKKGTNVAKSYS